MEASDTEQEHVEPMDPFQRVLIRACAKRTNDQPLDVFVDLRIEETMERIMEFLPPTVAAAERLVAFEPRTRL